MDFFRKCPFLSTIVLIVTALFIYGMLLASKTVKASNSVNLDNDPETVGVATAVQDIKVRLQNWRDGINERDYTVDYMPTEYVPDEEIINAFSPTEVQDDDGELTDEEKADRVLKDEEDAAAAARRAERSEKMKNGETDEFIRDAFKTKLDENDSSTPGDTYDGFYSVGDSYFTSGDTVIIGDSREQGFGMYSGLEGIVSYAQKSYGVHQVFTKKWIDSEFGKLTLEEAMAANKGKFKKVYIKFGLNEMGWADEATFDNAYYQLIDMIKYYQPDAVIYIQSIINVTAAKSNESNVFNNPDINARNEALKVVAEKEHVAYLDLNSVMADSEGNLPADFASDGIHIKQKYMYLWVDFLKSHAVVRDSGEAAALIDEDGSYISPEEQDEDEEEPAEDTVSEDSVEDTSEEAVQEDEDRTGEIVDTEAPTETQSDWETGGGI
ncbi:MAG: hypothetical protein IJ857_02560 [Lachnospiraceae bacterium]|nr:hypothetical protein [Lachnospiraceae bacterium]